MLDPNDYKCETRNGVYVCVANTNQSLAVYRALQDLLRVVAGTMATYRPDVPKSLSTLEVDGRVGPTTALAAQVVLAALHQLVPMPPALVPILSDTASGDEIIRLVSQNADLALSYINQTLVLYPNIMRPPTAQPMPPTPPKKPLISKVGLFAIGGAVITVGGLLLVARSTQRAADGSEDRSRFLPPPTNEEMAAIAAAEAEMEAEAEEAGADEAEAEDTKEH